MPDQSLLCLIRHRCDSFVEDLLAGLPDDAVPPAIALDVGRVEGSGQLVALEANTSWGAGLYGCEPGRVLDAALAADAPAAARWWSP